MTPNGFSKMALPEFTRKIQQDASYGLTGNIHIGSNFQNNLVAAERSFRGEGSGTFYNLVFLKLRQTLEIFGLNNQGRGWTGEVYLQRTEENRDIFGHREKEIFSRPDLFSASD